MQEPKVSFNNLSLLLRLPILLLIFNVFALNVLKASAATTDTSRERHLSLDEEPREIAQAQLPVYICNLSVAQLNPNPPIAAYRASVNCLPGTPTKIDIDLYQANVNFPNEFRFISRRTFNCTTNPCTTTTYVSSIERTKLLYASATLTARGTDGVVYLDPRRAESIRPYNNNGVMYPQIAPTRGDMPIVPFPRPPYAPALPRTSTFAADLGRLYRDRGWTIPPDPEAHHIKPVFWGGDNNVQTNAVFLGEATHRLFTNWWAGFSNRSW